MKKNAHDQNNRRPGEASLGRKAFSVVMSGLLVWSLWPANATVAIADELTGGEEVAAQAEPEPQAEETPV